MYQMEDEDDSKRKVAVRTYTSEDAPASAALDVRHCSACAAFALVVSPPLSSLPRRPADGARVLDARGGSYKLAAVPAAAGEVYVDRGGGRVELQYRLACAGCGAAVAYRHAREAGEARFTFLIDGALR